MSLTTYLNMIDLDQILNYAGEKGASDTHLSPGRAVFFRISGRISSVGDIISKAETLKKGYTTVPYELQVLCNYLKEIKKIGYSAMSQSGSRAETHLRNYIAKQLIQFF